MKKLKSKYCSICFRPEFSCVGQPTRPVGKLTSHHLVPRTRYTDARKYQIPLCVHCHQYIHHHFTNDELCIQYNSVMKLLKARRIQRFVRWINSNYQPELESGFYTIAKSLDLDLARREYSVIGSTSVSRAEAPDSNSGSPTWACSSNRRALVLQSLLSCIVQTVSQFKAITHATADNICADLSQREAQGAKFKMQIPAGPCSVCLMEGRRAHNPKVIVRFYPLQLAV